MSEIEVINIRLDTGELDRIAEKLQRSVKEVLVSLAFDIEAAAKQNAPVDTGALRSSIYTVTQDSDNYTQASGEAMGKAWTQGGRISEVERLPAPSGKAVAVVGASVEYAGYVELGTSKMDAQPYLIPAAEAVARKLNSGDTWRELFY